MKRFSSLFVFVALMGCGSEPETATLTTVDAPPDDGPTGAGAASPITGDTSDIVPEAADATLAVEGTSETPAAESQGTVPVTPDATATADSETPPPGPPWQRDFDAAQREALSAGMPVFVYFTKTY